MKIESHASILFGSTGISRFWKRHVLSVLWGAVTIVITTACSDDAQQQVSQTDGHTAVIYLNFKTGVAKQTVETQALQNSGTRAPATRAVDENTIHTVDVLSFKSDPIDPADIKKGTFFYQAQGTYDAATQSVRVRLYADPSPQTLVVLANVRDQVNALTAVYGEEKEDVMKRLLLPAKPDGTPDFSNGMPMWGELPAQIVDRNYGQTLASAPAVTLIRSVVKFTLIPKSPPITHGFVETFLYNHRTAGRISPDNYDSTNSRVLTPTVPQGATPVAGTNIYTDIPYSMVGEQASFYMFESDSRAKVTAASAVEATCLIVNIKSTLLPEGAGIGYYRIDFKDYTTGQYLDLLRGHDYQIEVVSIDVPPAATPEEAYKGYHSLKCRIVPWNEVQEEVKVAGNKRLKVDRREFVFDGDIQLGVASLPVKITTENTSWTIEGKPSWINLSQTSGTAGATAAVTISANSKNFGQNARSGVLTIRAGSQLQYRLNVSQQPACGFGNAMKLMRIGGNNYMTTRVTNGGVCWMIDASREGGPNMAARPRTYPFAAATVGPIYWGSIPHRACVDGWRLPTAWEVIDLVQKITTSYPAVFARLVESGGGQAQQVWSSSTPTFSSPTGAYESYMAFWTQTPMRYSSPERYSPASVLKLGGSWTWKAGSYTETEFRYQPTGNRWCLVFGAGSDISDPAGLPPNFNSYFGELYLVGGSVRAVHNQ